MLNDERDPLRDEKGQPRHGLLRDREAPGRRRDGSRGRRLDVLVTVKDDLETIMVIIELKSTNWSRMKPDNVRLNIARHRAQLYCLHAKAVVIRCTRIGAGPAQLSADNECEPHS